MINKTEIIISGLGGQGVVITGIILGEAAINSGKYAVQTQSYGAEARGTAAKSEVIISSSKIGFPKVRECDILVAMSQEAFSKHLEVMKEDGIVIADKRLVKIGKNLRVRVYEVPAVEASQRLFGKNIYANMILLGALASLTNGFTDDSMEKAIRHNFSGEAVTTNINAYQKGKGLVGRK